MYEAAEPARNLVRTGGRLSRLRPLALGLLFAGVEGCTTVILPPDDVVQPTSVSVLDHGRHTSLIVGTQDGAMIRYAYGDWRWYALRQTGLAEASGAILGASKAALGRKRHPGPVTPDAVARQINVPIESAIFFDVEADAAQALIDRLDSIFRANIGSRVVNHAYGLDFVPHPERYSLFHNSNSMVANWLREMGVLVDGWTLLARWAYEETVSPSVSPPAPGTCTWNAQEYHYGSWYLRRPRSGEGEGVSCNVISVLGCPRRVFTFYFVATRSPWSAQPGQGRA